MNLKKEVEMIMFDCLDEKEEELVEESFRKVSVSGMHCVELSYGRSDGP